MENKPTGFQVNLDDLAKMIKACENASGEIAHILHSLQLHGQSSQEWAGDAVSLDVADYYTRQLWEGTHCTYSTLKDYYQQLRATIATLQQTYANYANVDDMTTGSLEQL
jgi:hypothetical protein